MTPQQVPSRAPFRSTVAVSRRSLLKGVGVAAAAISAPTLAACGTGGAGSGVTTIEFWDMLWGLDRYEATAKDLVAEYNRSHPDVVVNYRLIPWAGFYEVFATAVASGTTPDVSTGATFQAFQYKSAIAPANDLVDAWQKDGTAKDVFPAAISAQVDADGKQTGLPWCATLRVLSYNKALFDQAGVKPPRSLEELPAVAKKLTGGGRYGFGFCGQGALSGQMLLSLMLANGGGLYETNCGPQVVTDRNREVCQLIQDMVRDGSIPKASTGWDTTDVSNALGRGEIAMAITEPALFNSLPNGKDIEIASPLEGYHGDKGTILWYSAMWLYESSKNKQQAADFLNWWLAHEQPLWAKGGTTQLPVRKTFYDQVETLQDPRYTKILDEWVPVGKLLSSPCDHALPTLNQVEGQAFLPTLVQDVLSLKPIDESLQKAQDALTRLKP
jgi:multiple sugar transport system substrate-binding protein